MDLTHYRILTGCGIGSAGYWFTFRLEIKKAPYPIQYSLLKSDKFNFGIPTPDAGKRQVNGQMAYQKGPDYGSKHVNPPDPAEGIEVREELAAAIPPDGPVEPPHDPVQVPLHPEGIEAGQGENGKLYPFHAAADGFPPQLYIPGDPYLYPAGVAGGHAQVYEPVPEQGV